ncbi:MAG: glutaminase [Dermatophilaceae bacterium]
MATCGMYDYAGEWLYRVGLPAKSGVSGGVSAALPGQLGLGLHSPLLDSDGNSVRGVAAAELLSKRLGMHLLLPSERHPQRPAPHVPSGCDPLAPRPAPRAPVRARRRGLGDRRPRARRRRGLREHRVADPRGPRRPAPRPLAGARPATRDPHRHRGHRPARSRSSTS